MWGRLKTTLTVRTNDCFISFYGSENTENPPVMVIQFKLFCFNFYTGNNGNLFVPFKNLIARV